MTEINIQELREKIAWATPAPWRRGTPDEFCSFAIVAGERDKIILTYNPNFDGEHDLELVVAAVNAIPALLDEVENARKLKGVVTALLEYCEHNTLSFQREKLEDYLNELRSALGKDEL